MAKYQIADTPTMLLLALAAQKAGYNRQLDIDKLNADLDPKGIHICFFNMLHEHIAGKLVDPHIRSMWHLKVSGSSEPVEVSLDISMEQFRLLAVHDTDDPDHEKQIKRNKIKAGITRV
jgi:hypothetical protein